jgi:hypothetical protein
LGACFRMEEEETKSFMSGDPLPMNSINRVIFQKRVKDKWLSKRKKIEFELSEPTEEKRSSESGDKSRESIELEIRRVSIEEESKLAAEKSAEEAKKDEKKPEEAAPVAESVPVAPPKPPLSQRMREWFAEFSLNPMQKRYYAWLIVVSACFLYNQVFLIARAAFWRLNKNEYSIVWLIFDYAVCDFIYLVDVVARFLTSFMENGELCSDKAKIAKRYIRKSQFKLGKLNFQVLNLIGRQ